MDYETAKANVKRKYTRPDGYGSNTVTVGLAYDPATGHAVEVTPLGCCRANGRRYASELEMLYYFDAHRREHFPLAQPEPEE